MADKEIKTPDSSGDRKISIQEALDKEGEQLHISELQALNIKELAKIAEDRRAAVRAAPLRVVSTDWV